MTGPSPGHMAGLDGRGIAFRCDLDHIRRSGGCGTAGGSCTRTSTPYSPLFA
jgi:hypothetical protein